MSATGGGGRSWEPVLLDGYEQFEEIGRGGFGVVYKARQIAVDRTVAIKVLHGLHFDDKARRRFDAERNAMGQLSHHPNIATVFDSGYTEAGQPYLVMEYLPGGSLADRLEQWGPVEAEEATGIAVRLAGALETAHRAGIVHGDVKPENVLLSAYGEPQLADFGIARLALGKYPTATNAPSGSLAHIAPELLGGASPEPVGDVYSLASTLFCLLTGNPPFVRPNDTTYLASLSRIQNDPVPDLRENGIPDGVATAVARAAEKDPNDRTPTAVSFAEELMAAGSALGWTPPAPAVEGEAVVRVSAEPLGRGRRQVMAATVGILAVVGFGAVWLGGRENQPAPTTAVTAASATAPSTAASTISSTTAVTSAATATSTTEASTTTLGVVSATALWVFEPPDDTFNDASSPGVGSALVVVGTEDSTVVAVDRSTGEQQWFFPMGNKVQADPLPLENGWFVVADKDGLVVALDGAGTEQWRHKTGSITHGPNLAGEEIILTAGDRMVSSLDPGDGSVNWQTDVGGVLFAAAGATSSGDVVVGTLTVNPDDGSIAGPGSVVLLDGDTGLVEWTVELPDGTGVWGTPLVLADSVVVPTIGLDDVGTLQHLSLTNGAPIDAPIVLGSWVRASPIESDGLTLVGSFEPSFYGLDVGRFGFEWRYDELEARVDGKAVAVDGVVYFPSGRRVLGLAIADGSLRWQFDAMDSIAGDLTHSDGTLYIADKQGRLYAVPALSG